MSIEIFALRHGATEWNSQKRLQGHQDIELSQSGIEQLNALAIPSELPPRLWYSSPLKRATQSAELLGITDYQIEPRLIEMNWGEWEGQRLPDLRLRLGSTMQEMEARGLDLQPPGGESPRQVRLRIMDWFSRLPKDSADIGIICHKGVLRCMLSEALDWDMTTDCAVKIDWKKGILFQWSTEKGLILKDYNINLEKDLC